MFGLIVLLIITGIYFNILNKQANTFEKKYYQGPVQEGYNEKLFRETGIYQKLKEEGT